MGGCVSTYMKKRNEASITDHQFIPGYRKYGSQSVPILGTDTEGTSEIYQFLAKEDGRPQEEVQKDLCSRMNWVEVLQEKAKKIPHQNAIGYRVVEKVENKTSIVNAKERTMQMYHLSPRYNITFEQMWSLMTYFALGLRSIGIPERAKVCMYEETRWEWMISIYGIWLQNGIATTVYSNLGEDALRFSLLESEAVAIIGSGSQVPALLKLLSSIDLYPIVIYLDELPSADISVTQPCQLYAWDAIISKGKNVWGIKHSHPQEQKEAKDHRTENENSGKNESANVASNTAEASTIDPNVFIPKDNNIEALIMYTSGTTGDPKGVVHTHGSLAAGFHALNHRLADLYPPTNKKSFYCAYLPLAHILEFAIVNLTFYNEMMVGFGSPRTLTDNFAVPHGDLKEYKPNFLIGVPRIYDTIKKAIESKLPPPGSLKRSIFDVAFEERNNALMDGKETPFWNSEVFSAARAVLGENMIGMLSGGGPLSASTQEFINVVCGGPLLIQGWGLTETVCCGTTQRLGDLEPFVAGQPLIGADIRLADTEEYKHTDEPEPRGELCVRGPFLFKGYYKQPELTKAAIDEEGWFHTGDVGSISKDGRIKIVGRIKALAKNCLGEYIAMEALEALYGQHPLCQVNGICILVHPGRPYIVALVLTEPHRAIKFAKENNLSPTTYPEVLINPRFHECAAVSFQKLGKQAKRLGFELPKIVRVLPDEWTPETGLVTPTSKLRRSKIEQHYASLIEDLFKEA